MSSKQKVSIYLLLACMNLLIPMLVSFCSYILTEISTFNPFWGVGFGLGYEGMAEMTGSVSNSPAMVVGGVVWPLFFFALITLCEGWLLIKKRGRLAVYLWIGFAVVNLINFPVSNEEGSLYQRLPLYSKAQSIAY